MVGLLAACDEGDPYVAPTSSPSAESIQPVVATDTLATLERAIRRGARDAAAALGDDDAAGAALAALAANAAELRLGGLGLHYLGETGEVSADGGWTARVEVTWLYKGFDAATARADVAIVFGDGGRTVAAIQPYGATMPLWLSGRVATRRTKDTLVLTTGPASPLTAYDRQAAVAVEAVRRVLRRPARLVVEVPDSVEQLNRAVGAEPGTYDSIAAITASSDGRQAPGSPIHVFVNPAVYGGLGETAAQVVMTHEAVHVVTGAPLAQGVDLWLLEGFADYVALRDTDLPISRTAGQIIESVRSGGMPEALPDGTAFDSRAPHLGAAYESAWLVCVTLAERGGEESLVAFYDALIGGAELEDELQRHFGWSIGELTTAWRARLADIAGVPDSPRA